MAVPETPLDWKSAKWWRNRPLDERLYFIKAPTRYLSATLHQAAAQAVEDVALSYADTYTEARNFLVTGRSGTGKTTVAVHAAMELVSQHGLSARFVNTDEYVEMLKDSFDNDGDLPEMWSSPHLVKYIKGVFDVLVLDGLGQERLTEFAKHEIGSLIRRRFEMGLSTIITTDMPLVDIITVYGGRVATALTDYKEIRIGR